MYVYVGQSCVETAWRAAHSTLKKFWNLTCCEKNSSQAFVSLITLDFSLTGWHLCINVFNHHGYLGKVAASCGSRSNKPVKRNIFWSLRFRHLQSAANVLYFNTFWIMSGKTTGRANDGSTIIHLYFSPVFYFTKVEIHLMQLIIKTLLTVKTEQHLNSNPALLCGMVRMLSDMFSLFLKGDLNLQCNQLSRISPLI